MDLYGQCVQVSITNATGPMDNSLATSNTATEKSFPLHSPGSTSRAGGGALLACCGPEGYSFQVREAVQRQAAATTGKGEGTTRGGKQPRRGQEVTPGTRGLDTSLPPKVQDTTNGTYQIWG